MLHRAFPLVGTDGVLGIIVTGRCTGDDGRRVSGIRFNNNLLIRWSGTPFVEYDIARLKESASGIMYQAISLPLLGVA